MVLAVQKVYLMVGKGRDRRVASEDGFYVVVLHPELVLRNQSSLAPVAEIEIVVVPNQMGSAGCRIVSYPLVGSCAHGQWCASSSRAGLIEETVSYLRIVVPKGGL